MAQLHVAIQRLALAGLRRSRCEKAMELYNVLGFGWALGHGHRDEQGQPAMLYLVDLVSKETLR